MAKILVVDDERNVVELVCFLLQRDGHETVSAYDGFEGLSLARKVKPDLIVLDIMLPGTDGYTVFTSLAQEELTKSIPIIVLTAKGQMRDLFTAANVVAFIEKPFDPKSLRAKVREILSSTESAGS